MANYIFNTDDLYTFANSIGADTKQKGDEVFFRECPFCKGGANHDKYSFSVNTTTGAYKCFRNKCAEKGHFIQLANKYDVTPQSVSETKQKRRLPQHKKPTPSEPVYTYLESRGISRKTADRYRISADKTNVNNIVFPFYDEKNILTFIKFRNMNYVKGVHNSKEWCLKDCQPILFGMAQCEDFSTLVITEGQMDSLTLAECGIKNAVSVPTGALGFTWVDACFKWVNKFEDIVVFGDFDGGYMTLLEKIRAIFGKKKVRAVRRIDYLEEKDANDIYRNYGKQAIIDCVKNAELPPLKAIKKLSKVEDVDLNKLPRFNTGFYELDHSLGGLYFGQLVLLTGKRGEGKSTFMSQIVANALEQRQKVLLYSGELHSRQVKSWLNLQIAGGDHVQTQINEFGRKESWVSKEDNKIINDWYDDYAYVYDNTDVEDEEIDLLQTIEDAIIRHDIKLVCIDNLMTAMDMDTDADLYKAQARFVKALAKLARKQDVVIILVAHPKKSNVNERFSNDSVSGSSVITDAVDVVINYERYKEGKISNCDSMVMVTKNRLTGILLEGDNSVPLCYSLVSKRVNSRNHYVQHYNYSCFSSEKEKEIDLEEVLF